MNMADIADLDPGSFTARDGVGQDVWTTFAPTGVITLVGDASYSGRYRIVGRQGFFQIKFSAGTSIATTAGTSYFSLPFTATGLAGMAVMSNDTTNIAVGVCHVDTATSRVYLPTQAASGNTFNCAGWCEV